MEQYDNTNRGAIFKNDRKEKENQPDLTGKLNVEGKDFYVSAWKKESKSGMPFYSISVSLPREEKAQIAEDDGTF